MFPQGLIDQWLSKPREGRRSVQTDPKATPAILANIRSLEVYCQEHPYEVFCASSLLAPPFALHALEGEEEEKKRLTRAPAIFAATDATAGVGGRYADKVEVHSAAAAAADHLHEVTARLTAYLQTRSGAGSTQPQSENGRNVRRASERSERVAQLVVRVVTEAAVAAAVRVGLAARLEAEELAAHQQRQSSRRLQLHVQDGSSSNSNTSGAATASLRAGAEGEEAVDCVTVRSLADHRRALQGLLSTAGLLRYPDAAGADDERRAVPALSAAKRARDSGESVDVSLEDGARAISFAWLREKGLRRRFGADVPPMLRVALAAHPLQSAESTTAGTSAALNSAEGWAALQLQITERDVLFAIRKVFAADVV